jgi:hypothetical protein
VTLPFETESCYWPVAEDQVSCSGPIRTEHVRGPILISDSNTQGNWVSPAEEAAAGHLIRSCLWYFIVFSGLLCSIPNAALGISSWLYSCVVKCRLFQLDQCMVYICIGK